MKKKKSIFDKFSINKKMIFKKGMIYLVSSIFIYAILINSVLPEKYSLFEGQIAKENIKSPRDVEDELRTYEKKKEVFDKIDIQLTFDGKTKDLVSDNMESFFDYLGEQRENVKGYEADLVNDSSVNAKANYEANFQGAINNMKEKSGILLTDEEYKILLKMDESNIRNMKQTLSVAMSKIYKDTKLEVKIPTDLKDTLNNMQLYDDNQALNKKVKELIEAHKNNMEMDEQVKNDKLKDLEAEISKSIVDKNLLKIAVNICSKELRPNTFYDAEKTVALKSAALEGVEPVITKKDQIIVKEGEPITRYDISLLRQLSLLKEKNNFQWVIYLSLIAIIIMVMSINAYYLYKYENKIFRSNKLLILVNAVNVFSLLLAKLASLINPYLIPLAFAPMILTMLFNYKMAIILSILNGVLMSIIVKMDVTVCVLILLNSVIASLFLRRMDQRTDIIYSSLIISIIGSLTTVVFTILQFNNDIKYIITVTMMEFVSCIISGVLSIGVLPIFETIFGVVTTVKLLELMNPNNPLLKKLLMEAPGTYHHAVLVANLAEVAAENIGANPILTRAGAYYHDVGKLKRPIFFKENQMGRSNPHDKIGPKLSALIITSHTKDGLDLAKEYKIPKCIQDIIQQHHGTSLVKYFYITAKNNSEKPEDVLECDYRYEGPKPQSREAALVMLADGCEAAVRSIQEPTEDKIKTMVNNIIKGVVEGENLDECDISFKDLRVIRESFLKALTGIYHERIEYPKLSSMEGKKH
ncbi:hypothetical protein SAMN02745248_00176 [Hathewaya proteolytica DSM 3090]|uniref:HD/PDEase domain-containing protein n=1 Tax=Hathewaya proteolytica DSM 3090 TaxID=1121331 RepID=A0A1M6JG50_9CLOT|nr:HDIG domain-containing metalloprotein [Hathewaya proteolytica]SHJ45542.1 hypothetical protein SAMN02745248_00176 [Hathewaya proteolytica DSM 3090]